MSDALTQLVAQVGRRLDDDLHGAQRATGGWSDAVQTECLAREALERALDRLADTGCWGEANRLPSGVLWRIAEHWLARGSLQQRARAKPRGYAGDFEMLAQIVTQHVCDDPLGRVFDRFFQAQAAPQAVRNRTTLVAAAVVRRVEQTSGPVRVVSVGSGPGLDLREACAALAPAQRQRLRIVLLDLDPAALEFAQLQLAPSVDATQAAPIRENLFRLAQSARSADLLDGADMIICTGLFDYLDDQAASALLSRLWRALRPGGEAWVFNFAPHNPSRTYMEWIGNWYLIYRTSDQMQAIAAQAGIARQHTRIAAEPSGVDLYWRIRRDEHEPSRSDPE